MSCFLGLNPNRMIIFLYSKSLFVISVSHLVPSLMLEKVDKKLAKSISNHIERRDSLGSNRGREPRKGFLTQDTSKHDVF